MMKKRFSLRPWSWILPVFPVLTLLLILGPLPGLFGETMVVGGQMIYRYRVLSEDPRLLQEFPQYENESNSQRVISRSPGAILLENRANLEPFESKVPFPVGERYRIDPSLERWLEYATRQSGVRITISGSERTETAVEKVNEISDAGVRTLLRRALSLTEGAASQVEAVERIVLALREDIRYRLNVSPEPLDVLRSGLADCDGYSNTAVLLLRVLGIPARMVASWIPPGHLWGYGEEGSGGFHAHLEVWYEDAGWVSYDVQATMHFVDPYHIVGYPRSGVTFQAVEDHDDRSILGLKDRPKGANHFFRRSLAGEALDPVFIGTIRGMDGQLLRDSPRTGQWVYLRGERGGGEGVLILPSGRFSLPGGEFFYTDTGGTYLEHRIDLSTLPPGGQELRDFSLAGEEDVLLTLPSGVRQIYRWHPGGGSAGRDGRWSLEAISLSPEGSLRIFSNGGEWIISTDREGRNSRYRFTPGTGISGRVRLADLEPYLEPGYSYLRFVGEFSPDDSSSSSSTYRIKLTDRSGRSFDAGKVGDSPVFMVPEGNFDRLFLSGRGELLFSPLVASGGGAMDGEIDGAIDGATLFAVDARSFNRSLLLPPLKRGEGGMILEEAGSRWRILHQFTGSGEAMELRYPPGAEEELEKLAFMVRGGEMTPLEELLR